VGEIMKIKNIISNVAQVLGLNDVVELVAEGVSVQQLKGNMNYNLLLRCASLVVANVAANFIESVASQTFMTRDGEIKICKFKHSLQSIRRVVHGGREVDYRLQIDRILVPVGRVTVTYVFTPAIESGLEENPFVLSHQALEYGILAEYAFVSGMFNEGKVWNEKFLEMMFGTKHKTGRSKIMPSSF